MRRIVLLLASLIIASKSWAGNTLSVSNNSGHPGDVVQVTISLDNTDPVVALQVQLPLNDNLKYVDGSASLYSERSNGHSLSSQYKDGILSLYVFSFSNNPLNGGSGGLLSFQLKLAKDPGTYTLAPVVIVSNASGTAQDVSVTNGSVTLLSPKITVVTETIDFGHIPIRSEYAQTVTIRNSGNETLDVSDVQSSAAELSVVEKAFTVTPGSTKSLTIEYNPVNRGKISESIRFLSNAVNGSVAAKVVADPFSVNELHVSSASGSSDSEVEIFLTMNNMEPITAVQCQFNLPEALKYVDGSLKVSDRASNLNCMASVNGSKLSLYIYSVNNTVINGNDGEVASFSLLLSGRSGTYSINPESVVLGNAAVENMTSASTGGRVTIQSPAISLANSLDMGSQDLTGSIKAILPIRNYGQIDLNINNVRFLSGGFSIEEELPLSIPAGETKNITVCYSAASSGQFSGRMNIYSSDPANRMVSVQVSGYAYEPNGINLSGQFVNDCQDYCLHIGLNNYTQIVGLQMDMTVPEGLDCSSSDLVGTNRISGMSSSIAKISERLYRIILFSMNNTAIRENAGDIFTLTLHTSGQFEDGTVISFSNIILSDISGKNYSSDDNALCLVTYPNYNITYYVDGQTYKIENIKYGGAINAIDTPTREGYTFSGWSKIPATMPANDVEITGTFSINSYSLVYKVDGETYKSSTLEYGTEITAEPAPTKEGYTFSGWSEIPATMPANDVEVTGTFSINSYSLVYKVDGETYKSSTLEYGTEITAEPAPTKEGYTFSGWSEIPATMPANDVEVTGTFSINSYSLVYKVDGETYKSSTLEYGTEITAEPAPTKEGYTFSGWSEIPATMPANDAEITGTFSINSYSLVYKVDGETYKSSTLEYGTEIVAEPVPSKEGYTFSGWSEIPATMPANDVEVTGTFSINSYSLVYKVDGETYKSSTLEYGTEIAAEPVPSKEGYTFSGWSGVPATMPASDVEITGTFSINSYKLIYKVDGIIYKTLTLNYNAEVIAEIEPTKDGYTFSGWSETPATMPANDVEVTGTFSINSYSLVYKVDGETYKSSTLEYGTEIAAEPVPSKEGYTFSGWSGVPATMPASDVEITGTFSINSYKLIYKVDGIIYKTLTLNYNAEVIAEMEPTKDGYTFSGWSETPATMPANDVEVTGTFSINSYSLVYKVDGETYKSSTLEYGTEIVAEPVPSKEGYTFSGWSEIPATMPANDVEVTGTFSINSYSLVYKVDGETYKSSTLEYGTEIAAEPVPSKEGYTFSGWSGVPATMPASDVEITGTFSINSYKLIYKVDGIIYKTLTLNYNAEVTAEIEPTKDGYTFSGWSEIPSVMPAGDVEVIGSFSINSYNLIYKVDGETYKTYILNYASEIVIESEPIKEGYTFSGWSGVPATMPASDVEITGTFSINSYKLIYKVDGILYKTLTLNYNAEVTAEMEPTKDGYTFSGWSEIPSVMPAGNIEITGAFIINTYKLTYVIDGVTYKSVTLNYGEQITPESDPEKEGYTFSGWSHIPSTMPSNDVEVTGTFNINSYKLTYKVDGVIYKTVTLPYNSTVEAEPDPAKEGYTFSGWSDIPAAMPASNVEISGSFGINSYVLTYIVDDEIYKTFALNYASEIVVESEPTKEGYTFSGWSEIPTTMPASDVEVTGYYSINTYRLIYIVEGEIYKTILEEFGSAITAESEPVKEGSTFSGWSYIPTVMPARDVTITGSFDTNTYSLIYLIDGDFYKSVSVSFESEIIPEATPSKEGYTFSGWSDIPSVMPANDVTITGSFSVNSYNLNYMVDGEIYKTIVKNYGSIIIAEAVPAKEGYTFSGWSDIPSTMPANDVEITGTFAINTYNLVYKVDGETYRTYTMDYASYITSETEPTKEGYTFSGWSEPPSTMPASDVEVIGTFSINSYKLIYKVDGIIYKTLTLNYNAEVTAEMEPIKDGYTFSGWSDIPSVMPAGDVEVIGSFSINSYNLVYKLDGETYKTYILNYASEIVIESEPIKEGYTFSGWSGVPATMPASDVEITGTFSINSYKLIYKVDGILYKTLTLNYNAEVTADMEPTKNGYTFSGWSEIPATMPAKDVEVIGTFSINFYSLVYKVDGETYKASTFEYGAEIAAEPVPTKEGYSFSGWSEIPASMPAHDVEVIGSFEQLPKYVVTFLNFNNTVLQVDTLYYGLTPSYRGETPTREPSPQYTYTFSGWSPEIVSVTGDITYTAIYDFIPVPFIAGDADGDGIVGINDVIMTIDASLGNFAASFNKDAADLDGDGNITINDVIMLIDLTLNQ